MGTEVDIDRLDDRTASDLLSELKGKAEEAASNGTLMTVDPAFYLTAFNAAEKGERRAWELFEGMDRIASALLAMDVWDARDLPVEDEAEADKTIISGVTRLVRERDACRVALAELADAIRTFPVSPEVEIVLSVHKEAVASALTASYGSDPEEEPAPGPRR